MIENQIRLALETQNFIEKFGLKRKYVAEKCNISEGVFSKFLHSRLALSSKQEMSVRSFLDNYIKRH